MASKHKITASRRTDTGKGASRRLRHAKQVPAILYGGELAPLNIQLDHEQVLLASHHEWFFSSVLDLDIDGELQPVLVRDWQVHPYKQRMLHMDFLRIDEKVEIRVVVPLHFLNQEQSPADKASDVIISHSLTEVEVACLSKDLPGHIDVDLADLEAGTLIHLSDLKLPNGVELTALRQEGNDQPVVSAQVAKGQVEDEDDAAAGEDTSPEVPATKVDDAKPKGND